MIEAGGNICRLCLKESELRNSHILPEFLYENLYDEKHRTLLISRGDEKIVQKGIREKLLCQECETKLSRYEKYAKELILEIPNFTQDNNLGLLYSDSVDYLKLKLFQLSILWRASVSSNTLFQQVKLGPHEEKIRAMINEEYPGKVSDYGCLMLITLDANYLHTIIQSPTQFKVDGHNAYKFATGSLDWIFFVTSHKISRVSRQLFLQDGGLLRVIISRHDEKSQLMRIAQTLKRIEGK